jgi:cell division protein FtsW (lipid II flippase)
MDLSNYVISVALIAITMQFGEAWLGIGATLILIIASKDLKASILMIITLGVMYFINGIGMKEYWLFAIIGLVALGYLLGLGTEEKEADPYAGLLGGGMGM